MEEIARNLYYLSFVFYFCGLVNFALNKNFSMAGNIILAGFCIHTLSFALYIFLCGYIPMHKRTQNTLPRTWGLCLVLLFSLKEFKDRLVPVMCIITILLLFITGFPIPLASQMEVRPFFIGFWPFLWFHFYDASFVLFAYCFSVSASYLIALKFNSGAGCKELTKKVENSAFWGFVLFTLAQLSGSVWAVIDFGDYWHWKPMHLLSVSIWMFYAAMIHLKWIKTNSERLLSILGVIGFTGMWWWTLYHDFAKSMVAFIKGGSI